MKIDTILAKEMLSGGDLTCVLCRDGEIEASRERGVKPLLDYIDSGRDLHEFSIADKVVGRAAAYLYAIIKPKELYAEIMSRAAEETLALYGVKYSCGTAVDSIRNRANTGICPMEEAVANANSPEEALAAIKEKIKSMAH